MTRYASIVAILVLSLAARPAHAGTDLDVFVAGLSVEPNVMILFDNSGSMNASPPYDHEATYTGSYNTTTIYDRCQTFRSNCTCSRTQGTWKVHTSSCGFIDNDEDGQDDRAPSYVKIGNRRNYETNPAYQISKLAQAKSTIDTLLLDSQNDAVRFGLMVLNGSYLPSDYTSTSQVSTYHNDKTILKAPVGTSHTSLKTTIDALTANAGTPLANRTIAVAHYYKHDGYFSAADPIQYPCQRNFLVLMTDGRPQVEGNTAFGGCGSGFTEPLCGANADGQFTYIESWLGTPHDKDGDGKDPDYYHFNVPAGCTSSSPDAEPCEYQNGGSDYLDDVAKVLFDNDLRPDVDGTQTLITYTIGFGEANGLLQRSAAHGGGRYFTANTADELADAFAQTINSIQTETESFVAPVVPVSQTTRTQSGNRLYIALFRPKSGAAEWPGNLKKYQVSETGQLLDANSQAATDSEGNILATARSYWDTTASGRNVSKGGVGEVLLNRAAARNLYTNLSGPGSDLTVPANAFTVDNSVLTAAMLNAASSAERTQIINYVAGQDTEDANGNGNITEKRAWILGDIVHSVPLVVNYSPTDAMILVGANDGMLHAFDDATGDELWAFLPDGLLGTLKQLIPGNAGTHPYFVDGSPKMVTIGSQKVVLFGLGRGGREYYALDITSKTAPTFLWKVSNATTGMSELGQTWSDSAFTKVSSGIDVAIVGAGYDPYFDDPSHTSANTSDAMGRGIFVLNALTGALVTPLIRPTGMDFAVPSAVAALDVNGDGILDRAYVGDLGGQMWRVDTALTTTRLFSSGGSRKIFYPPDVVRDKGFLSVFFGTGDRSNPLETNVVDRMYAVKDDGGSNKTEASLTDVTTQVVQNGSSAETTLKSTIAASGGWFVQLNQNPGEKVLASPTVFFNVYFSTFTPVSGVCNAGGDARLYTLNYETGGIPDSSAQDPDGEGPLPPPTVTREMRVVVIGNSIPTELTVTIQKNGSTGFDAAAGAIHQPPLAQLPNNVTPIAWRQCSTEVPCP